MWWAVLVAALAVAPTCTSSCNNATTECHAGLPHVAGEEERRPACYALTLEACNAVPMCRVNSRSLCEPVQMCKTVGYEECPVKLCFRDEPSRRCIDPGDAPECACTLDGMSGGVQTGALGCASHSVFAKGDDTRLMHCYINGGEASNCPCQEVSTVFPGAAFRRCSTACTAFILSGVVAPDQLDANGLYELFTEVPMWTAFCGYVTVYARSIDGRVKYLFFTQRSTAAFGAYDKAMWALSPVDGDDVFKYISASLPSLLHVVNPDGSLNMLTLLLSSIGQKLTGALLVEPSNYSLYYNPQDLNSDEKLIPVMTYTSILRFSCVCPKVTVATWTPSSSSISLSLAQLPRLRNYEYMIKLVSPFKSLGASSTSSQSTTLRPSTTTRVVRPDPWQNRTRDWSPELSLLFSNLVPGADYSVVVQTRALLVLNDQNSACDMRETEPFLVRTSTAQLAVAPTQLGFTQVAETSTIILQWRGVSGWDSGADLESYRVLLTCASGDPIERSVPVASSSLETDPLFGERAFQIQVELPLEIRPCLAVVKAVNRVREGPGSSALLIQAVGEEKTTIPPTSSNSSGSSNAGTIAGPVVGALVACALLAFVILLRRRRRGHASSAPKFVPSSEELAIQEKLKSVSVLREQVSLNQELGSGQFGQVFEASVVGLRDTDGHVRSSPVTAAVKMLSAEAPMSNSERVLFLQEAARMVPLRHANIVTLLGVCFDGHPILVVLEFMPLGDLKSFLQRTTEKGSSDALTFEDKVSMILQLLGAMAYLQELRYVHRDIACRNVLLAGDRTPKLSDFGLARGTYQSDYYRKSGSAPMPLRWMARESVCDGIFTTMSDMHMFGVLMWELLSDGATPWGELSNQAVLRAVLRGDPLPQPAGCSLELYACMTRTWSPKPHARPSAAELQRKIRDPDSAWRDEDPSAVASKTTSGQLTARNSVRSHNAESIGSQASVRSTQTLMRSAQSSVRSTLEQDFPRATGSMRSTTGHDTLRSTQSSVRSTAGKDYSRNTQGSVRSAQGTLRKGDQVLVQAQVGHAYVNIPDSPPSVEAVPSPHDQDDFRMLTLRSMSSRETSFRVNPVTQETSSSSEAATLEPYPRHNSTTSISTGGLEFVSQTSPSASLAWPGHEGLAQDDDDDAEAETHI
eukprot:m.763127 g.763127  ORF g.763127 m.763127 type:complete len:1144 (-) comp59055_c0_seq8:114-3545(-)